MTTLDGRRLGFCPEALYVGFLVPPRGVRYRKPPIYCPNCGSSLEVVSR